MSKSPTTVPVKLTGAAALRMIRQLAENSRQIVVVKPHGTDAMRARRVSRMQVERCLQKGTICEGPFMNSHGNWQVTMYRHAAGEELKCAVAIEWEERLLVITVMPVRRKSR